MEPFVRLDAVALPIARPNVDTDQIVPARYLQKPRTDNFGDYLFRDVRLRSDGSENPDFVLNLAAYRGARIVVAERNFGCGSSREHAVWALHDYGFRAAIAPSFGDIFASNALKNGFLPIVLPAPIVDGLLAQLASHPGAHLVIDLPAQSVHFPDGSVHAFDVEPFAKRCLIDGLDEIDYTLTLLPAIESYERRLAHGNNGKARG
jgi:3-isopropylmalate/(R)-2-methylmalate dehydratase small subunit